VRLGVSMKLSRRQRIADRIAARALHRDESLKRLLPALRGLLNYTGGWDLTQPDHPIVIARKALEFAEGVEDFTKVYTQRLT